MVHTLHAAGLKPDDFKKFTEHYASALTEMMLKEKFGKFDINEIEKIDGQPVYHQRVDVPIPFVDPRSMLIKASKGLISRRSNGMFSVHGCTIRRQLIL